MLAPRGCLAEVKQARGPTSVARFNSRVSLPRLQPPQISSPVELSNHSKRYTSPPLLRRRRCVHLRQTEIGSASYTSAVGDASSHAHRVCRKAIGPTLRTSPRGAAPASARSLFLVPQRSSLYTVPHLALPCPAAPRHRRPLNIVGLDRAVAIAARTILGIESVLPNELHFCCTTPSTCMLLNTR